MFSTELEHNVLEPSIINRYCNYIIIIITHQFIYIYILQFYLFVGNFSPRFPGCEFLGQMCQERRMGVAAFRLSKRRGGKSEACDDGVCFFKKLFFYI